MGINNVVNEQICIKVKFFVDLFQNKGKHRNQLCKQQ